MSLELDAPIQFVKGVGPKRSRELNTHGISTVEDLLRYPPFRYEDRTNFSLITNLVLGEEALVSGVVSTAGQYSSRRRRFKVLEVVISDSSGSLPVKFFNQPYLRETLKKGTCVILFGIPRMDSYSGLLSLLNPELEVLTSDQDLTVHMGRIVPVYRRIGSISTRQMRTILFQLLNLMDSGIRDPLPDKIREKWKFPGLYDAFWELHFPCTETDQPIDQLVQDLKTASTPSRRRFIFEEFFSFQIGLELLRAKRTTLSKKRKITLSKNVRDRIKSILPFHPTNSQKRVVKEIIDDLRSSRVMYRLLQGDVGSGKTIVALQAVVVIMENGFQAALMAPTEILAEQHFKGISRFLENTPYRTVLLTGSVKNKEKKKILSEAASGDLDLIVGTHALIQDNVKFSNLGLVVVDEQHRFGVVQRSQLTEKGERTDTLVMTATPIPRSLALTAYGDLDLSILDELPPGRKPVSTVIKTEKSRQEVYTVLDRELRKGCQIFIVYPLVDESEKIDIRAASVMAEQLQNQVFRDYRIGLIHGKLSSDQKEKLMNDFAEGEINVLVATTVVEVGIDVPNATVMMVENAERFGLSQLHQLRGRIGRGQFPGLCILMVGSVKTQEAYQRLNIMRKSSDGFEIAEKDLEIRGPGEFLGTRQSGLPAFRFGNIVRDQKWLQVARNESEIYLEDLFEKVKSRGQTKSAILDRLLVRWKQRYSFFEVG